MKQRDWSCCRRRNVREERVNARKTLGPLIRSEDNMRHADLNEQSRSPAALSPVVVTQYSVSQAADCSVVHVSLSLSPILSVSRAVVPALASDAVAVAKAHALKAARSEKRVCLALSSSRVPQPPPLPAADPSLSSYP